MRIDRYLWSVRYFKSRSLAAKACRDGKVKVRDKRVKASKEVFSGDVIHLRKNQIDFTLEILDLPSSRVGAKIVQLYVKDLTPDSAFEHKRYGHLISQGLREKGKGRPTKKERRDWEDYWEEE